MYIKKMRGQKHNNLRKHPLFKVWAGIIARCYTPSATHYGMYGGSGVRVCDLWRYNFLEFYNWALLNGWRKGLEIDKDIISKNLGIQPILYSPELCSIVTKKENCNSKKNNRMIEYNGEIKSATMWAEQLGIKPSTLIMRINAGWDLNRVFTQKVGNEKRIICETTGEIFESITQAAKNKGTSIHCISKVLSGAHKTSKELVFKYLN